MNEFPDKVTPDPNEVFKPIILTPLHKVKVVFMMPEPYCGGGTASGLAFAWKKNPIHKDFDTAPVPFHSLMLELKRDVDVKYPSTGDLSKWARQGVLLWNSRLTTFTGMPCAHMKIGWQDLTKEIVETVYLSNPNTVFCFFGDTKVFGKDLPEDNPILELPVPSLDCGHSTIEGSAIFSTINKVLRATGQRKINWKV